MVIACRSFIDGFKYCVELYREDKKSCSAIPTEIINIVQDDSLPVILMYIEKYLKPLADAIAILERADADLGQVWVCLIAIHKNFGAQNNEAVPESFIEVAKLIKYRLNERAQEFDARIFLIAFYLTPQNRLMCTSKKYTMKDMHKMVVQQVRTWNPLLKISEGKALKDQLMSYHQNKAPHQFRKCSSLAYWSGLSSLGILSEFAVNLFNLCPSSASLERLFSKLNRTKPNSRNRMTVENMTAMGKIKLDAINTPISDVAVEGDSIDIEEKLNYTHELIDLPTTEVVHIDFFNVNYFIDSVFDCETELMQWEMFEEEEELENWNEDDLFSDSDDL